MLNEEKIKIMTKLALYEKNIGREDFHINEYYRNDFIALNNIKTRVAVTISCLIIIGLYALLNFNPFILDTKSIDLTTLGIKLGSIYISLLVVYTIISTRLFARRYKETQRRLNNYNKTLQKLNSINKEEEITAREY